MTPQTEAKLRKIARKENWSEEQFQMAKEELCFWAKLDVRITTENIMKKVVEQGKAENEGFTT